MRRSLGIAAALSLLVALNPATATVTPSFSSGGTLNFPRSSHTATLLLNGNVLIAGGDCITDGVTPFDELYDSVNGGLTNAGTRANARSEHTATLLPNGTVLLAGGFNLSADPLATAELYVPGSGFMPTSHNMVHGRRDHTATLLPNGKVLLAGGSGGYPPTAELYDPATDTFSLTTGNLIGYGRSGHTATLLPNGNVLLAGGTNGATGWLKSAELYNPATGLFTQTAHDLNTTRSGATATLLPNGKVLITGGNTSTTYLDTAEEFDPADDSFTLTANTMRVAGAHASATLLPNGTVLIAGGTNAIRSTAAADVYDPVTRMFSGTANMTLPRCRHTATVLPNAKVLVVGGATPEYAGGTDLYDYGGAFDSARRPIVDSAPTSLSLPAPVTITGSRFLGDSEASSGSTNSSATNYPLLQMKRTDNGAISFITPTSFSDVLWTTTLPDLASGQYAATIVTNGVPSAEQPVQITRATPAITSVAPGRGSVAGGQSVTITGTSLTGVTVTIGGNSATVTSTTNTNAVFVTPPHAAAVVDVTVTAPAGGTATATAAYTYGGDPPSNVVATAVSPTAVSITWTAGDGATAYEVLRSSDHINYTPLTTVSETCFLDPDPESNTAYLYTVRATAPEASVNAAPDLATTMLFSDDPVVTGTSVINAAHLIELRTAVTAVLVLAGQAGPAFTTDPTITANTTTVKAAHIAELRTSLNAARALLLLPAVSYTRSSPTAGVKIYAPDVNDLRTGVK